jgi:hypothetical protein
MKQLGSQKLLQLLGVAVVAIMIILGVVVINATSLWFSNVNKEEMNKKVTELNGTINDKNLELAELKGAILAKDEKIKAYEEALKVSKAKAPDIKVIVKNIKSRVVDDATLKAESLRILGAYGLNGIRVVHTCP